MIPLQVQLVLYMNATMEGLKRQYPDKAIRPGAMFYYHIARPLVDADVATQKGTENAILKELRVKGFLNRDDEVIQAMDHGLQGGSDVIPVRLNKEMEPDAKSHVISDEEFFVLGDYVQMLLEESGRSMVRGEVDCAPYKIKKDTGCDYCEYHGICGFDAGIEGYAYRCLRAPKERAEIIDLMRKELEIYHLRKERTANDEVDSGTTKGY